MAGIDGLLTVCSALLIVRAIDLKKKKRRSAWEKEWLKKRRTSGVYHTLIREMRTSDHQIFLNFLRVDEESFDLICSLVTPFIIREDTNMRQSISVKERVALTLRFLATGNVLYNVLLNCQA